MNKTFTPGPWRLIGGIKGDKLNAWVLAIDGTTTGRELHVIEMRDIHPIPDHLNRRLSDMKIIAAAPEMFELLEKIYNDYANLLQTTEHDILDEIDNLLTKITTP